MVSIGAATLIVAFVLVAAVSRDEPGQTRSPTATPPATAGQAARPGAGPDPAATTTVGVAVPASAAMSPHTAASGRPRRWTVVDSVPTGAGITDAATFAGLVIGSCLAWPDPAAVSVVPCDGPHSAEVTNARDITADFPTTPNLDDVTGLAGRLCPDARRAWTGTDLNIYIDGYVWRFEPGTPGQVMRRFLCTVALAGYAPFTGTLRDSG